MIMPTFVASGIKFITYGRAKASGSVVCAYNIQEMWLPGKVVSSVSGGPKNRAPGMQ